MLQPGLIIAHSKLLSALVHFELDEREKWIVESEKAKAYLQNIVEIDSLANPFFQNNLALCYALEGNRQQMEATIQAVRKKTSTEYRRFRWKAKSELHIAICYLILGDQDKALSTLEAASQLEGPTFVNRELDLWFMFDQLRGNPRFDALLED